MAIKKFIKSEFEGWNNWEKIIFSAIIIFIILVSLSLNDNKIALISAICGILYTILAGKGKITCYLFGISATICYSWIAYQNTIYGNLAINLLYYLPVQIIGIFQWKKHLKKEKQEIIKTKLSKSEFISFLTISILLSAIIAVLLANTNDLSPTADAFITIFSILGLILTVKRCIEQWYIWTLVNFLSIIIWVSAYLNGSNCFITIIMWCTYFVLGLYFLYTWKKELN